MKTIDNLKEKYLSGLIGLLVFVLAICLEPSPLLKMDIFVEKAIDISSISFGFLLAVLALLMQSETTGIKRIKEAGRFSELIAYNKKSVMASAVLAVMCLIYVSLDIPESYKQHLLFGSTTIGLIWDSIVFGFFAFQIMSVYLFLDLFYFIVKQ